MMLCKANDLGNFPSAHFNKNGRSPEAQGKALAPAVNFSFRLHTLFSPKGRVAYATNLQWKEEENE